MFLEKTKTHFQSSLLRIFGENQYSQVRFENIGRTNNGGFHQKGVSTSIRVPTLVHDNESAHTSIIDSVERTTNFK